MIDQNTLLAAYRAEAIAHGMGIRLGDHRKTNRAYDKLQLLLKKIDHADAGHILIGLFDDDEVSVQLWAAAHSLELNESAACKKLQEIKDAAIPLVSTSAHYTLQEWKGGRLKFRSQSIWRRLLAGFRRS